MCRRTDCVMNDWLASVLRLWLCNRKLTQFLAVFFDLHNDTCNITHNDDVQQPPVDMLPVLVVDVCTHLHACTHGNPVVPRLIIPLEGRRLALTQQSPNGWRAVVEMKAVRECWEIQWRAERKNKWRWAAGRRTTAAACVGSRGSLPSFLCKLWSLPNLRFYKWSFYLWGVGEKN